MLSSIKHMNEVTPLNDLIKIISHFFIHNHLNTDPIQLQVKLQKYFTLQTLQQNNNEMLSILNLKKLK